MAEPEIYYYLKRMDEDLQDELKPKLKKYINLDSRHTPITVTTSSGSRIGLIHASQRNNVDLKNKVNAFNLDLIIFLIQGAGKPKESTQKYKEEFPTVQICWDCGTEYLIETFERLENYLKGNPLKQWNLEGWIAPEIQQLSALAILCQGYLAVYAECEDWEKDEKLAPVYEQFEWPEFQSDPSIFEVRKNLKNKKDRVGEARWWLDTFELWDEENQALDREKWEKFERDITQEWYAQAEEQMPGVLIDFLKAIEERATDLKQPKIVADVYWTLREIVGNR